MASLANQERQATQPSLAQLRAFVAVAEQLHFREAAAEIGMSQPALSGAVSALEETLGVQLLERTTRKVLLSPAGERVAARARTVLEAVGDLLEEAEAARAPFTGVLRLGVIPTVAPYLLPRSCGWSMRPTPTWTSRCTRNRPPPSWRACPTDASTCSCSPCPGRPQVTELPLFDEDFVLVTPKEHWLGGRGDIPRQALQELDLLLLDEGHCLRDQALDICREAGRDEDAPVTTSAAGLSTLVQLVAGGLGVTLLPRTALRVETGRNDQLTTGYFADPAPSRRIALAMRTGAARQEEFEEFAGALRGALRGLPVRIAEG